ncbi:mobilization protein [Dysgonomonas sp. GY617]|uniref:mobilization protein n=1 Tax=Dysgonomonas sp. GY617 TaxID=2780420 RepID=UPI0018831FE8|nr:mobilization protein [Dysgonomonas sp. GY617]MBF0577201.1 mobilization protein [Dysgonomonas sp. GY617]
MKHNPLEQIILYVLVACVATTIATLARISAMSLGVDSFTAFIVFVVVLSIEVVVYLSIHVILQGLMLPWIEKLLLKIPYFKNKSKLELSVKSSSETITEQLSPPTLDEIRNEQQQNKTKRQDEKLNIALGYTRKAFALYVADQHIELLCNNVKVYANKLDLENLQPIKTNKELAQIEILHFGWNIWNHFKVGKQIEVARFLKTVFPDILRETEVDSIKSHLKDDELKGLIKIKESLI